MDTIGVLAFAEYVLGDVTEMELALNGLGYAVLVEQMGYDVQGAHVGYYYDQENALVVWLCRCHGDRERCRDAAETFVQAGVSLIVALTAPALDAALAAAVGRDVPIVYSHVPDADMVGALAHRLAAHGRAAGVRDLWLSLVEERLALLSEIVPPPTAVHAFFNPDAPAAVAEAAALRRAAGGLGLEAVLYPARSAEEIKAALAGLQVKPEHALFRLSDPTAIPVAGLLGAVAHEQYIPYVGLTVDELERCGALFALSARGVGRQAAGLVDGILKGADAGGLAARTELASEDASSSNTGHLGSEDASSSDAECSASEDASAAHGTERSASEDASLLGGARSAEYRSVLGVNLQAAQDLRLILSPAVLKRAQITIPAKGRTSLGARLLLVLIGASAFLSLLIAGASRLGVAAFVVLAPAGALAMAILLWLYLRQVIIRPIQRLTFAAEKIGAGDLEASIGEVNVEDEIGMMARAFRRMRSNLKRSYVELETLARHLEGRLQELTAAHKALQQAQSELELTNRRIIEADDSARFALTTYIHDEILGVMDDLAAAAGAREDAALVTLAAEAERRVRRLRFDLSAPILQDVGIELRRLVLETLPQVYPAARQIAMSLDLDALDRLPELEPAYGFLLYRFVHGAVSNAFRHAGARSIRIAASLRDGQLCLTVADDGRGFDPERIEGFIKGGHYFFHDIHIRARQLDGTFEARSKQGHGSRLAVTVPVNTFPQGRNLREGTNLREGDAPATARSKAHIRRPR